VRIFTIPSVSIYLITTCPFLDRASATPTLPPGCVRNPTVPSNPNGGLSWNRYPPSIPTPAPEGPLTNDQVNHIIQRLQDIVPNNGGGLGLNGAAPRQLHPIPPPPIAYRRPCSQYWSCVTRLRHPVAVNADEEMNLLSW